MIIRKIPLFFLILALIPVITGCPTNTRFSTIPEGANIYLDGEYLGKTPYVYHDRSGFPQRHRLQVYLPGYEPEEFFIDREMNLVYTLILGGAYGIPMLWAWWMPNTVVVNLQPAGKSEDEKSSWSPPEPERPRKDIEPPLPSEPEKPAEEALPSIPYEEETLKEPAAEIPPETYEIDKKADEDGTDEKKSEEEADEKEADEDEEDIDSAPVPPPPPPLP